MTAGGQKKFDGWVDTLVEDLQASKLDGKVKNEIIAFLRDPIRNDEILAKINGHVLDVVLKDDLVNTVLFLDGTFEVVAVGRDGRPTDWL